jgi:hypothetical protein
MTKTVYTIFKAVMEVLNMQSIARVTCVLYAYCVDAVRCKRL